MADFQINKFSSFCRLRPMRITRPIILAWYIDKQDFTATCPAFSSVNGKQRTKADIGFGSNCFIHLNKSAQNGTLELLFFS